MTTTTVQTLAALREAMKVAVARQRPDLPDGALDMLTGPQGLEMTPDWHDARAGVSVSIASALRALKVTPAGEVILAEPAEAKPDPKAFDLNELLALPPRERMNRARKLGLF